MKYVSIDIETTGLDKDLDQVLEIGAIFEDTLKPLSFEEIPKFHAILKYDRYSGSAFAINLNQRIFKIHADRIKIKDVEEKIAYDNKFNICRASDVSRNLYNWFFTIKNRDIIYYDERVVATVAGKNYAGFDAPFLSRLPEWNDLFRFKHKVLDPASLYWNANLDTELPSLPECLERAGLPSEVSHDAVEDAWQVIEVLRKKY